ncbi:MAG: ISKra4 family transposase [Pseudomonadota bacterium]|nr:ISKra4 family transposase [Pseudomonadota bacterium]
MHVSILLQITGDDGAIVTAEEVAAFGKATERPEDVGLSLADGKALLAAVQDRIVQAQAAAWTARHRCCEACGARRRSKGSYPVLFRTLYGDVQLTSPRLHRCGCQDGVGSATVSPLRELFPSHVAPERLYLEVRWASLVPYAAAADLLADVLPVASGTNATTVRQHVLRVAERAEAELGKEHVSFVEGCPAQWAELPIPEGRIVVGLDGGYVRDWDERKANFELIVGRSMPEDRAPRYIGLVHGYDRKPKRRLFDLLQQQGLQANQDVTFLTDGGEEVRALTELVTPEAEHVLDWFHIAMRLTVLEQYARGVAHHDEKEGARLLLQTRTRALDGTLRPLFERWHPGLANDNPASAGQTATAA